MKKAPDGKEMVWWRPNTNRTCPSSCSPKSLGRELSLTHSYCNLNTGMLLVGNDEKCVSEEVGLCNVRQLANQGICTSLKRLGYAILNILSYDTNFSFTIYVQHRSAMDSGHLWSEPKTDNHSKQKRKLQIMCWLLKFLPTGHTKGYKGMQTYHMQKEEILNVCEESQWLSESETALMDSQGWMFSFISAMFKN